VGDESMSWYGHCRFFIVFVLILVAGATAVSANEPNVGILRVDSFQVPREVAPNSVFSAVLDVEYGLHGPDNATIRAAIYRSDVNYSNPLWESNPEIVSTAGERIWNVSLTSPSTEGYLNLTAYAFFLDQGAWRFYNNSINGPGFSDATIEIRNAANLEIDLGAAGLSVSIDNQTITTSVNGEAQTKLSLGRMHILSVAPIIEFQNATRIVFEGWNDGNNQTQRRILLDGDTKLVGSYKKQYLLHVNSPVSPQSDWYDIGSNITLQSPTLVPMNWPLNLLGLTYRFVGWTGNAKSQSPQISIIINSPTTINANFSADYSPIIIPTILAVGIAGTVVIALLRHKAAAKIATESKVQESTLRCGKCGEAVEEDWAHCIRCGASLGGPEPIEK